MSEENIIKLIRSQIPEQTIFQLTQVKTFIDNSLKEILCRSFEKEEDKIKYLIEILQNLRDFTVVITNEDTVRNNIVKQIMKSNNEIKLGNESEQQEKSQSQSLEENSAPNQLS
jgi:adenosyl cobinamide kinase/adenosyl cobinamide phosphate guanylyltransferase